MGLNRWLTFIFISSILLFSCSEDPDLLYSKAETEGNFPEAGSGAGRDSRWLFLSRRSPRTCRCSMAGVGPWYRPLPGRRSSSPLHSMVARDRAFPPPRAARWRCRLFSSRPPAPAREAVPPHERDAPGPGSGSSRTAVPPLACGPAESVYRSGPSPNRRRGKRGQRSSSAGREC